MHERMIDYHLYGVQAVRDGVQDVAVKVLAASPTESVQLQALKKVSLKSAVILRLTQQLIASTLMIIDLVPMRCSLHPKLLVTVQSCFKGCISCVLTY